MPTTISGDTGVSAVQPNTVALADLTATGTPSASNFLRGDNSWATAGSPPGTVELLQEDTFTSSGTWTKATGFDADDTIMIFLVGGGASGGAIRVDTENGVAAGGFPGSALIIYNRYADAPSNAFTLTVGAGGAAATRSSTSGVTDGNIGSDTVLQDQLTPPKARYVGGGGNSAWARFSATTVFKNTDSFGGNTYPLNTIGYFSGEGVSTTGFTDISGVTSAATKSAFSAGLVITNKGALSTREYNGTDDWNSFVPFPGQLFGAGGSAARAGATDRASWNPSVPAIYDFGGAGSGTANGVSATGIGGGGGACVRQNANATSGAGGSGGMIVRYYRGRVSPFQILLGV